MARLKVAKNKNLTRVVIERGMKGKRTSHSIESRARPDKNVARTGYHGYHHRHQHQRGLAKTDCTRTLGPRAGGRFEVRSGQSGKKSREGRPRRANSSRRSEPPVKLTETTRVRWLVPLKLCNVLVSYCVEKKNSKKLS